MRDRAQAVYLAGSAKRDELETYRRQLEAADTEVTSRWLTQPIPASTAHEAQRLLRRDLADIARADAVVLLADGAREGEGDFVIGVALAHGKLVIVVGDSRDLHHHGLAIRVVERWDEAFVMLTMDESERILRDIIRTQLDQLEHVPPVTRKQAAAGVWSWCLGALDVLSRANLLDPRSSRAVTDELVEALSGFGLNISRGSSERTIAVGVEPDDEV